MNEKDQEELIGLTKDEIKQIKKKQGKKNRASGQRFEQRVRKDLESKGWIVAKWMNNVSDYPDSNINKPSEEREDRKLIPAKHKFRGIGIPMSIGTGFPDFIAFRKDEFTFKIGEIMTTAVIGVEAKSNGYLDKEEREKCLWLLDQRIFSKILIASKGKKRGEIIYKEF